MFRIAAAQFLAQLWIGAIPEAAQIARHLDGPAVRREQRQHHRLFSAADARRFRQPEQFLQFHRRANAPIVAIFEAMRSATRNEQGVGRLAIQRACNVGRKRDCEIDVIESRDAVRCRANGAREIDLVSGKLQSSNQPQIGLARSAKEPRVCEQSRGYLQIRSDRMFAEDQRVVAIDGRRADAAALRIETVNRFR